jgi:predicted PurR-regulated permease PerM
MSHLLHGETEEPGGAQLAHRLFLFFVALVGVFVLLRDGAWIGNRVLESADRLLGDPGERLASKMADTVRGIVNGTVVVAVGEGILIGVAYVLAGVPNPMLFALLTMAFAMVPLGPGWCSQVRLSCCCFREGASISRPECSVLELL